MLINRNFFQYILVSFVFLQLAQSIDYPLWPEKFKYQFTEEQSILKFFKGKTSGTMYYNYNLRKYRLDRESGKHDRYCGFVNFFQNTPCSHYVIDGTRYLYFPKKNYCCRCCTVQQGCGMLKNDWMIDGIKTKEFQKGDTIYEIWQKKGNQENQMIVEQDSGLMIKMNLQPNDRFAFDKSSFTTFFDDRVFDLPQKCKNSQKCPFYSLCAWIPND